MKRFFRSILLLLLGLLFFVPFRVSARENVDYWYIKDFQSEIRVNLDSSLDITEKITADCGGCFGKHGIFRILPTQVQATDKEVIKTPIELQSITDFRGR